MRRTVVLCELGLLCLAFSSFCVSEDKATSKEEAVLKYEKPEVQGFAYLAEPFDSQKDFDDQWIFSQAKKDGVEASISKYDGQWIVEEPKDSTIKGDKGLILREKAKHHAVSTMLPTTFEFKTEPLIVQYEVKFHNNLECGGAYMKLLSASPKLDLDEFTDKTDYTIMFGPDKCGEDGKLHFIFKHKNPKTGKLEEKHAKKPTAEFAKIFEDKKTHLFTLVVRPDNTFEIRIDKNVVNSGSLLSDFEPPVNPPVEIDDPSDKKPDDWDEREKIVDPKSTKPEDWDEDAPPKIADPNAKKPDGWLDDAPENVADPNAVRPADWDDEEDGEWEPPQIPNPKCAEIGCGEWKAPMIDNPKYKGKWSPPLINNPAYKGKWQPKKIKNPDYFEDKDPFKMTPIAALGFELWSMTDEILFDNIIISSDQSVVDQWTSDTWDLKYTKEFTVASAASAGLWNALKDATNERPWLWAVYIAVIILPIVLIFVCCFPSKKDEAAEKKKTDEPTADDKVTEESAEKVEEEAKEEESEESAEKEDEAGDAAKEEEPKVEPEPQPEEDVPPPDASPRTRAARRRTRKDT